MISTELEEQLLEEEIKPPINPILKFILQSDEEDFS